jgi:hypothetical protein
MCINLEQMATSVMNAGQLLKPTLLKTSQYMGFIDKESG